MKISLRVFVSWLTALSLLVSMVGPVMAGDNTVSMDMDTIEVSVHSGHTQNTSAEAKSPCCDHDCQCDNMNSSCANGGCQCAIGSSGGMTHALASITVSSNPGSKPQHARFAIVTYSSQPDNPPPCRS